MGLVGVVLGLTVVVLLLLVWVVLLLCLVLVVVLRVLLLSMVPRKEEEIMSMRYVCYMYFSRRQSWQQLVGLIWIDFNFELMRSE